MDRKPQKLKRIDDEEWRDIPNTNGLYQISNYGRLKSFIFNKENGHIMKGAILKNFLITNIKINKKPKTVYFHKLTAEVWLPKPSENHVTVTHIDRNLRNNHVSNLKWQTIEETGKRNGEFFRTLFTGQKHPGTVTNSRLKEKDIVQLKKMLQRGVPQVKIAKMFCLSEMQVTRIKRGINWGHVTIEPKNK